MSLDSLVVWAAHSGAGERVELVCDEHPDPATGHRAWRPVRAPGCVADLPLHVPLELLALGVAEVAVRRDGCGSPEALDGWLVRCTTLAEMADRELAEPPDGRRRRDVLSASAMPTVERRSLFGLGRREPRPARAWSPDVRATEHQRLRAALRHLGAHSTDAGATDGVGWRLSADGCRASGQCVTACPNDALALVHSAGRDGVQRSELRFDPSLCNACGRCIEFCDAAALSAPGPATFNDLALATPSPIATVATRVCERCRAAFAPSDKDASLCPTCAARRANPFGSALPPEALARLQRAQGNSAD
ncbi:4Fe-4S dicluster domain-containing protein [Tessaracoccus oleiagri]|uniref:4Fe-4S dicluster domain-containing protein n=1 Tax=Tessaracoccus oleiagri TaxID=686624 RepID=A0A1G9J759_9ACTN|nr:4Fe-4S dicluster domain-containing protein [Tessaracoccus oleiagri]SDL32954.1 4Fe-4S dicluster domain-containing protein [Tessaracoccus oleiagri]